MSLTLPAVYSAVTAKAAFKENYIFQLYYVEDTSFTGISLGNTTVGGVYYEGCITNTPQIRESINLAKSTAKSSNISIKLANFKFNGSDFSEELFGGTNKYINHTVKIYSQLNDESTLSNCLQIFNGRLTDIKHNESSIDLQIESKKPWDFIGINDGLTTNDNTFIPVAYGDYTDSLSPTIFTTDQIYTLRPVVLNGFYFTYMAYVCGSIASNSDQLLYYEKAYDTFIPLDTTLADISGNGAYLCRCESNYQFGIKIRPIEYDGYTIVIGVDLYSVSNSGNAYDTSTSTYCRFRLEDTSGPGGGGQAYMKFNIQQETKDSVSYTMYVKWACASDAAGGSSLAASIKAYDSGDNLIGTISHGSTFSTQTESVALVDGSGVPVKPAYVRVYVDGDVQQAAMYVNLDVYDIYIDNEITLDEKVPLLYCGADGYTQGYSGGSGLADQVHETHRDMLDRFSGFDDTDGNIDGWAALDTARSGWNIRWWTLKEIPLKNVLEKLQYEGCFIFRFRADGSGQYIHIPNTPSADHTLTPDDFDNLKVEHVPFSELLTKQEIQYGKHPANNTYLTSQTFTNATARTNWNIQTKENIAQIKLDAYVAPTIPTTPHASPNNDFASYYDNIFGDIKVVGSCKVVNPAFYGIEVGDIVNFSSMDVKAFADNWTGDYMIIEQKRSPGNVYIKFREI